MDGSVSSQLLTGLLMALPVAPNDSRLIVKNLKSTPYIDMTLALLEAFGIQVRHFNYRKRMLAKRRNIGLRVIGPGFLFCLRRAPWPAA